VSEDRAGWVTELDPREALLVHAFRCAAAALTDSERAVWGDVERAVARLARPGQRDEALRAFRAVMRLVGGQARTVVRFHVPRCSCLGHDEAAFLALCRELSAGCPERARATARTLVRDRALARLLRRCSVFLECLDGLAGTGGEVFAAPRERGEPSGAPRLH